MSFINWGEESPEQKEIRRRFAEEQMLFEQAVRMSRTTGSLSGGAAGASSPGESRPAYCGGDKLRPLHRYWSFDVLLDKVYQPTYEDLDTWVSDGGTSDTTFRAFRDDWHKKNYENILAINFENRPAYQELPSPVPASTLFYKTNLVIDTPTTYFCKNVNEYEEWSIHAADIALPGVTELRTLPAVSSASDIPLVGLPGDIIYVINDITWYAWDPAESEFSISFYLDTISFTHLAMAAQRDAALKAKNELVLSVQPFLWAAKYIPEFRIKKDNL